MDDEIRKRTRRIGLSIDSYEQTADETVDQIMRRCWTEGLVQPR